MDLSHIKVLVVGDIMLDEYIEGNSDRISPEAPVPIVKVTNNTSKLGGAANVATNCKSLGANVFLIGLIGKDSSGKIIMQYLKDNNINYLGPVCENELTVRKIRVMSRSQQLLRIDYEKDNISNNYNLIYDLFKKIVVDVDVVIFSDYGKGSLKNIKNLILEAKKNNKTTLVDPIGVDFSKYNGSTFLKPNYKEMTQVIGHWKNSSDLDDKVFNLMKEKKIDNIILTLSENGCILFQKLNDKYESKKFPVNKREVYDVTGAGDAFISIFALMITSGLSVQNAIERANKGAGSVVEKLGTYNVNFLDFM